VHLWQSGGLPYLLRVLDTEGRWGLWDGPPDNAVAYHLLVADTIPRRAPGASPPSTPRLHTPPDQERIPPPDPGAPAAGRLCDHLGLDGYGPGTGGRNALPSPLPVSPCRSPFNVGLWPSNQGPAATRGLLPSDPHIFACDADHPLPPLRPFNPSPGRRRPPGT